MARLALGGKYHLLKGKKMLKLFWEEGKANNFPEYLLFFPISLEQYSFIQQFFMEGLQCAKHSFSPHNTVVNKSGQNPCFCIFALDFSILCQLLSSLNVLEHDNLTNK